MKRLLSLVFLLSSFQQSAFSQIKIEITLPDSVAGKAWVQNQIRQAIKEGSKPETPPVVVQPPANCAQGPEIRRVYDATSTSLWAEFHGSGVEVILAEILTASGQKVAADTIRPTSARILVSYGSGLGYGSYFLKLSGVKCTGSDLKPFTIENRETGAVNPGPVLPAPDPQPSTGYQLRTLSKGMDEHLKLDIRDQDGDGARLVTDVSTEMMGPNYHYRYIIGGRIIDQKEKLKNYVIAGPNPVRILKMKLKDGLSTINHWGTKESDYPNQTYYQRDAGEGFSLNTSFAFQVLAPTGPQKQAGFLNHIPQNYDPSGQQPTWASIGPDIKLPDGHIWIAGWQGWDPETVFRKGVTHLPHHNLPWDDADGNRQALALKAAGKTYNNVPRIEHFMGLSRLATDELWPDHTSKAWWPNGPLDREAAIQKANQADISDAVWIGETMENESWMHAGVEMWDHFYKRLKERYQAKGKPFQIVHNYYFLWRRDISLTRDQGADYHKSLLRLSAKQLPQTEYSPGGTLSSTTMITQGIYLNAPDLELGTLYETIFRFEINRILGYESGVFLFAPHEWRPNNKFEYTYPDGKFYADNKVPLDPGVHIGAGFFAQVYGKLFHEWGATSPSSVKRFDPEWNKGWWYPNGKTEPQGGFPYYKNSDKVYYGFNGGADLSYFSQKLFCDTFGKTTGGVRKYLKYRLDGGAWIVPSQFSCDEVVDAYHGKRGFVMAESLNGKTAWFYYNGFADNKYHTLEVELPGGQVVADLVAGNGVHAKIQ